MKLLLLIIVLLSTILSGCREQSSDSGPIFPEQQWRSLNIHHYSVEQTLTCFCINGGQKMLVTVTYDTINAVMRTSDSTFLSYSESRQYRSIDSLFGIIRYSKDDSLVISYNAEYGFPEFLDINPQQHPVDGGVLIETSNLKRLQ